MVKRSTATLIARFARQKLRNQSWDFSVSPRLWGEKWLRHLAPYSRGDHTQFVHQFGELIRKE